MDKVKKFLKLRKKIKKKKAKFKRQEWFSAKSKKFGKKWRRPKGKHSKLRMKEKARGTCPGSGYSSPRLVRELNPLGYKEVRISNPKEIDKIDPIKEIAVISKSVGKKKRLEIMKLASSKGIKIIN